MGQVCCAQIDKKDEKSLAANTESMSGGWRLMVQTTLDFENMDRVLNRLQQSEVLALQVSSLE